MWLSTKVGEKVLVLVLAVPLHVLLFVDVRASSGMSTTK